MSKPTLSGRDRDPWPEALWTYKEPDIRTEINLGDEGLSPGDDVSPHVSRHKANGVRLIIPPGEYVCSDRRALLSTPGGHYHLKGGGDVGDVTIVQSSGQSRRGMARVSQSGAVAVIENILLEGYVEPGADIRVEATEPDAEMIFKHFRMPHGVRPNASGIENGIYLASNRSGNGHCGSLRMLWCEVSRFTDNGLYCDGPNNAALGQGEPYYGRTIVVGGKYSNNNISNIRLGNPYSVVYRATVIVDDPLDVNYTENYRGIRIRQPDDSEERWNTYNHLISGCDIHFTAGPGIPLIGESHLAAETNGVVENTRIHIENNNARALAAISDHFKSNWEFNNIHVTGTGRPPNVSLTNSPEPYSSDAVEASRDPWWGDGDFAEPADPDGGTIMPEGYHIPDSNNIGPAYLGDEPAPGKTLQIIGDNASDGAEYVFFSSEKITPLYGIGRYSANDVHPTDLAVPLGNGMWVAAGAMGGLGTSGDTFQFEGELSGIHIETNDRASYEVYVNGEPVNTDAYPEAIPLHSDVYEEGYTDGYDVGMTEGHETGFQEGYAEGHTVGHEEGYDDGFIAGVESAENYDPGDSDGTVDMTEQVKKALREELPNYYVGMKSLSIHRNDDQ